MHVVREALVSWRARSSKADRHLQAENASLHTTRFSNSARFIVDIDRTTVNARRERGACYYHEGESRMHGTPLLQHAPDRLLEGQPAISFSPCPPFALRGDTRIGLSELLLLTHIRDPNPFVRFERRHHDLASGHQVLILHRPPFSVGI